MLTGTLPHRVEGARVVLKKQHMDFAEAMFSAVDKDRARLGRFLPWVHTTLTVDDTIGFIKMSEAKWETGETFNFGIFDRDSGAYIGNIGVISIFWEHDCCEIGYWIAGDIEGKGYMSDAVTALEKACFSAGFNRVEIRCDSRNERSAAVPRRLGYTLDGCLRSNRIRDGAYYDTLVFGKLRA